jgi:hypothetical protein
VTELIGRTENSEKGNIELLTGQKQLSTRLEVVEKGQDILSSRQNEIKELLNIQLH